MANQSETLVSQASNTTLSDHAYRVEGRKNRVICTHSYKLPPQEVTTQPLVEHDGVDLVALTTCRCGTIFRFYPHGGRGLTGAWRETTIQLKRK